MNSWKLSWTGIVVLLAGCGDSPSGEACTDDVTVTCPCPGATTGELTCEDGFFRECNCPKSIEGACSSDVECDDGAFCNGQERCDPLAEDADKNGCVGSEVRPLCDDGIKCTVDSCSDRDNRCAFEAPDADGDGFGDSNCEGEAGPLGNDCDDDDANRFPGNTEICDDEGLDEDCDPSTFGHRDEDGDGAIDHLCCNGNNCGDDCNDKDIAQRPLQPEFCDKVDNDCDGDVDENAGEVPWYVDSDGDGFGTADEDAVLSCIPIEGRSLLPSDCNDDSPALHPAQIEICDLADNNCNGFADEGRDCGVLAGYPVIPGSGVIVPVERPGGTGGDTGTGGNIGTGGAGTGGDTGTGGAGTGGTGTGGTVGTPLDISCGSRDISGATVINSNISGTRTWSGVISLEVDFYIGAGDRLIIEAGTVIIAEPGVRLTLGGGRLDAIGTEASPIKLCGREATAGYWDGLHLTSADPEGSIEWVLIADGGGGGVDAALIARAAIPIKNVRVENSGNVGVSASKWGFQSSDLTVTASQGTSLVLTQSAAVHALPKGGTFTGNGEDKVRFLDSTWADVMIMRNLGIPYLIKQNVFVQAGGDVTIEAGVEIQMEADTSLNVGWNSNAVDFKIAGTPAEPVVFRGRVGVTGFWNQIEIGKNLNTGSLISNLVVQDAGSSGPAVLLKDTIPIDGLRIEDSSTIGLQADAAGFNPTSQGISIAAISGTPLLAHGNALVTLPPDTQFADNTGTYITVSSSTITDSGTIPAMALPYYISSSLLTSSSSAVTIAPGTNFLFGDDASLTFGWNQNIASVFMNGTAQQPIVFDHILGSGGKFLGLILGGKVSSTSILSYVHILNAGSNSTGALHLTANPALPAANISNCLFKDSASYGIYRTGADKTQDYSANGNVFQNNTSGDINP